MRFKSSKVDGFRVFAVAGINTVSFGIEASDDARKGLLGFAVERFDPTEDERYMMPGFKVFASVVPNPDASTIASTRDHPVQSFLWDDFTAKDGREYEYSFFPVRGKPRNLDHSARPVKITIRTEPLFSDFEHDVFFNRGVASSQAYARKFQNKKPDKLDPPKDAQAREWLSRKLDDALLRFIRQARANDGLLCCFYEFRYAPAAQALREAIDRGVDVRLIVDAKNNETTDKKGVFHAAFPRVDNLDLLEASGIPLERVVLRTARKNDIQHNKFMVLQKGKRRTPTQVWTGSTNLSDGGIHGQTNVGHWVRNEAVAASFAAYWDLLSGDPGGQADDTAADAKRKNAELAAAVADISPTPDDIDAIPEGVTPIFSPRRGLTMLDLYVSLIAQAQRSGCITLAFGISKEFKEALREHTPQSPITFMMLEKRDAPTEKNRDAFVFINARQNVYKAWGSYLPEALYQWTRETNARLLGLNKHVSYVHSKFLLRDPLGDDPLVVTGSANFSAASTNANDENMLLIRGDKRVADIYFTEFNRIFNHYYFRSVTEATKNAPNAAANAEGNLFLSEKPEDWLGKYKPGSLKRKRVDLFTGMSGFA
ncbi:MAG TPA: phospholipase D-like domain-containing protein [Tahibacter sp.]|nr:phospholipase D-like domain-containing protein [Tahibacter sp.]